MKEVRGYGEDDPKAPVQFDEEDHRVDWDAAPSVDDELPFEIPRD